MSKIVQIGDNEYEVDNFSETAKATLGSLQFVTAHIEELNNMVALLTRAKNSYISSLKKEMLSSKAGFIFEDD